MLSDLCDISAKLSLVDAVLLYTNKSLKAWCLGGELLYTAHLVAKPIKFNSKRLLVADIKNHFIRLVFSRKFGPESLCK